MTNMPPRYTPTEPKGYLGENVFFKEGEIKIMGTVVDFDIFSSFVEVEYEGVNCFVHQKWMSINDLIRK